MMQGNRGKTPITIIAVALVVIMLAGAGVFMLKGQGGKKGAAEKAAKPTAEVALGDFVVNLADLGQVRYLKANVVLAVTGEAAGGGHGGEGGPSPAVRDAVIEVLSSKRFAELARPDGRVKLKKDLIAAVNKRLEGCRAVNVYFNEFAMQ